jgi:hypothetical protein
VVHNFDRSSRQAGKDWLQHFMKRNPEVSLRKSERMSLNRIGEFNEVEVKRFLINLEIPIEIYRFRENKIYNVDETDVSTVQKPKHVLGPEGQKRVGAAVSCERGKTVTVVCAFCAGGDFIQPMFIYPRIRMSLQL